MDRLEGAQVVSRDAARPPVVPAHLDRGFLQVFPTSLTIIPTYRCTAACEQCCFESSPKVKGRLSLETIQARIREARETFPALQLVVFSGGEVFLLKEDLYESIGYATSLGLLTRVVSNGSWAKSPRRARFTAERLAGVGLGELNLSTGLDHQKWVPLDSVINAAEASVGLGITTLMTIEQDTDDSDCLGTALADARVKRLLGEARFSLRSNSWMPFHAEASLRKALPDRTELASGCSQVFNNLVVTPHDQFSGCCGLTFEHIPEMKLGRLGDRSMATMYEGQLTDFLKAWIHMDGPYRIMTRLFGKEAENALSNVNHICQACVIMHQHPRIREELIRRHREFVPEVLARLNAKVRVLAREREVAEGIRHADRSTQEANQ